MKNFLLDLISRLSKFLKKEVRIPVGNTVLITDNCTILIFIIILIILLGCIV